MILKSFEEICDDESICNYCSQTNYGEYKSCVTPSGYSSCEGTWCKDSYDSYLEEYNVTEKLVKYQNNVKLLNKEEMNI